MAALQAHYTRTGESKTVGDERGGGVVVEDV